MLPTVVLERFPAGQVMITQGAFAELAWEDVSGGLARHILGDWGELGEADRKRNDDAVERGGCLLSRYVTPSGTSFWITTEHDRSATTILLPDES